MFRPRQELPLYSKVRKSPQQNPGATRKPIPDKMVLTQDLRKPHPVLDTRRSLLEPRKPEPRKPTNLVHELNTSTQLQDLNKNLTQVPLLEPRLILRSQLKLVER